LKEVAMAQAMIAVRHMPDLLRHLRKGVPLTATRMKNGTTYELENIGTVSVALIKTALQNDLLEDGAPGLLPGLPQTYKALPDAKWPPKTWADENRGTPAVVGREAAWSQKIRPRLGERSS
jgi:hypothetical protein